MINSSNQQHGLSAAVNAAAVAAPPRHVTMIIPVVWPPLLLPPCCWVVTSCRCTFTTPSSGLPGLARHLLISSSTHKPPCQVRRRACCQPHWPHHNTAAGISLLLAVTVLLLPGWLRDDTSLSLSIASLPFGRFHDW